MIRLMHDAWRMPNRPWFLTLAVFAGLNDADASIIKEEEVVRKIVLLGLSMFLLCGICGQANAAAGNDDPIKIGYIENLTGDFAAIGALCKNGMDLAMELNPTVLGRPVKLITVDSKSDKTEAANAASRLIEKEGVVAILGPGGSGINLAIGEIVKVAKIPTLTNNATSPLITIGNPYYFRCCFTNDFKAEVMAAFALKQGWKKVGIATELTNDSAVNMTATFKKIFPQMTGDPDACPVEVAYSAGDADFSAQLGVLAQYKLDAIYNPGGSSYVPLMINQAQSLGHNYQWLGTDSWDVPEFIILGGAAVVDCTYACTFFDAGGEALTPTTTMMIQEYGKKHPGEEVSAFSALAFDAYNLILQAIEDAGGTNSEAICKALTDIRDFPGVTGYLTFDKNRNVENLAVVKTVGEDGKFKYVTTVYPNKVQ